MKRYLIVAVVAAVVAAIVIFWPTDTFAGEIKIYIMPTHGDVSAEYLQFSNVFSKTMMECRKKDPLLGNYKIFLDERWGVLPGAGEIEEKFIGLTFRKTDKLPLWSIKTGDLKRYPKKLKGTAKKAAEVTHQYLKDLESQHKKEKI